jgi:3-oxoacyl-[acyl-carrier protein] reductase
MNLDIADNTALITASSSGLGKASALALAREGVNVVINGRNADKVEEAIQQIKPEATGKVVGQPGDITDKKDIEDLVEFTMDTFGQLDHLVTSAGGPPSGPFMDMNDEDWYEAYDLLVMSVVRLARACEKPLRSGNGGSIVNITSRSVKEAIDNLVLSNSVRMAVIGLEKTLSKEFAPEVRVNSVLPGSHETSRIRYLIEQSVKRGEYESYEEGLAARGAQTPLGRIGDPIELGNTVAFLSSPRSGYINGAAIPIDGGSGASNL